MFNHLVVPVDNSSASFKAVPVAARMAAAVGGKVEVITVVDRLADVALAREAMRLGIERLGPLPLEPVQLVHASHTVAGAITRHIEASQGGMLLMSAHGHGRSAAVLGSTSDEVLRSMFGPVIIIGPHATEAGGELGGTYVVPLDGSTRADGVLPIVAAWTTEFGGTPWMVEVGEGSFPDVDGRCWIVVCQQPRIRNASADRSRTSSSRCSTARIQRERSSISPRTSMRR